MNKTGQKSYARGFLVFNQTRLLSSPISQFYNRGNLFLTGKHKR